MYNYNRDHYLALPEDVIAFAWSAPMRELAKEIGMSDTGLKKLLKSQGITTPPQGYWNKLRAGKKVPSRPPPLPRGPGEIGRVRLDERFRDHVPRAGRMPVDGPFASKLVPEDLDELRARELKAIGKVKVPRDLVRPHRSIAAILATDDKRRQKHAETGWDWYLPEHDHPFAVRQLKIADALLKALARRGHDGSLSANQTGYELHVTIGDVGLSLDIGQDRKSRSARHGMHSLPASSPLSLRLGRRWKRDPVAEWHEKDGERLEKKLAEIVAATIVAGEAAFRRGLVEAIEAEEQHARWQEEERQRRLERLRVKRLADLEESGALLRRAEEIRALVARVGLAMENGLPSDVPPGRLEQWKRWALAQADTIDPVLSGQVMSHLWVPGLDEDQVVVAG